MEAKTGLRSWPDEGSGDFLSFCRLAVLHIVDKRSVALSHRSASIQGQRESRIGPVCPLTRLGGLIGMEHAMPAVQDSCSKCMHDTTTTNAWSMTSLNA